MPKKDVKRKASSPTEKKPYKSNYADIYVGRAQHIVEVICTRKAEKEKTKLVPRFWQIEGDWQKFFKYQLVIANRLLKTYDVYIILEALNQVKWCWSLNSPQLIIALKNKLNYIKGLENQIARAMPEGEPKRDIVELKENVEPFVSGQSLKDKLKEMDNG